MNFFDYACIYSNNPRNMHAFTEIATVLILSHLFYRINIADMSASSYYNPDERSSVVDNY